MERFRTLYGKITALRNSTTPYSNNLENCRQKDYTDPGGDSGTLNSYSASSCSIAAHPIVLCNFAAFKFEIDFLGKSLLLRKLCL